MTGQGMVFTKKPEPNNEPQISNSVADIKVYYNILSTVSATPKVFTTENDPGEMDFKKMPDIQDLLAPVHFSADRALEASGGDEAIISKAGKIYSDDVTFDTSTDVDYVMDYYIDNVASLRKLMIASFHNLADRDLNGKNGKVELWEGDPDTGSLIAVRYLNLGPISFDYGILRDLTDVTVRIYIWSFTATADIQESFIPYGVESYMVVAADFKNDYENYLKTILIGGVSGGLAAGAVDFLLQQVKSNPVVQNIAMAIGIPVVSMLSAYLATYASLVLDGVLSWSDFDLNVMLDTFWSVGGALTMGVGATLGVVANTVLDSKAAKTVAASVIGGGVGAAYALAYMAALSTIRRFIYP